MILPEVVSLTEVNNTLRIYKLILPFFILYFSCSGPILPSKKIGDSCQTVEECKSLHCEGTPKKLCVQGQKKTDQACLNHDECESKECLVINLEKADYRCAKSSINPPVKKLETGKGPCSNGKMCKGGLCIRDPRSGEKYCSGSCSSQNLCPASFCCRPLKGGKSACAKGFSCPKKKKTGALCKTASECEKGLCLSSPKGSYCSSSCQASCDGPFLCQKLANQNNSCVRYQGGDGGKCKKKEIQAMLNCKARKCLTGKESCVTTCQEDYLSKDCLACFKVLDACPKKQSCSPFDPKCCKEPRETCLGKP